VKRGGIALLFLLGLSFLSAQETLVEIPNRETLEHIDGKPGIIKTMVSQETGDNKTRYLEMYTDVHIVTAIPMDKLRETILDFTNYSRIFLRNHETLVVWENGAVFLDMTVGAKFLGIDFLVKYRVTATRLRDSSEEFILDFNHVSDDGNVEDISGRWYVKKLPRREGAEQQCYVRYYAYSKMLRQYPLQRTIMSLFINSESKDLMEQFVKAADGR
jgi:hypothetical protein